MPDMTPETHRRIKVKNHEFASTHRAGHCGGRIVMQRKKDHRGQQGEGCPRCPGRISGREGLRSREPGEEEAWWTLGSGDRAHQPPAYYSLEPSPCSAACSSASSSL